MISVPFFGNKIQNTLRKKKLEELIMFRKTVLMMKINKKTFLGSKNHKTRNLVDTFEFLKILFCR